MTDGGQVPNEGRPEHLLPGTGTDPAQGGGGWGTDLVGQAVPAAVPGTGYTFIDEPDRVDQLDDEDDVLLMPGPQGSWSDASTSPVVPLGEALAPQGGLPGGGYPGHAVYTADGVAFPSATIPVPTPIAPAGAASALAAPVTSAPVAPSPVVPSPAAPMAPAAPMTQVAPAPMAPEPVIPAAAAPQSVDAPEATAPGLVSVAPVFLEPIAPQQQPDAGSVAVAESGPGAHAALVAEQAPGGMPVEPSWPPVDPPGLLAAEAAGPTVVETAPDVQTPTVVLTTSAVPITVPQSAAPQGAPARRPLHAGPPIPDPSLMTGQVPVRSLADRGPSVPGGTPPHGIPVPAPLAPAATAAPVPVEPQADAVVIPAQSTPSEVPPAPAAPVAPAEAPEVAAVAEVTAATPTESPAAPDNVVTVAEPVADTAVAVTVESVTEPAAESVTATPETAAPQAVVPAEAAAEAATLETVAESATPDTAADTATPDPAPQTPVADAGELPEAPADGVSVESTPDAVPAPDTTQAEEPTLTSTPAQVPSATPVEAAPVTPAPVAEPVAEPAAESVTSQAAEPAVAAAPEAPSEAAAEAVPVQAVPAQVAPPRRIAAFLAAPAPLGLIVEPVAATQPQAEATAVQDAPAEPSQDAPAATPAADPAPGIAPATESAAEPTTEPVAEPTTEPTVEPSAESTPQPAAEATPEAITPEAAAAEPTAPEAPQTAEAVEAAEPAEPAASPIADAAPVEASPEASPAPETTPEAPEAPEAAEAPEPVEPVEPAAPRPPAAPGYDDPMREAVHQVMRERRDIRNGFRPDPVPHEVLLRVLEAAHTAPSVGYSQPWDFVVIRSSETRQRMHELAVRQREAYADSLPKGRAKQFKEIKIEAILETPVNIVVTADRTRGGRHTLGRHTQPQMAPYSAALAVENLWLAARAEGLGVGWVSFFDEEEMVRELGLPEHLEVVAYLCVGYVDAFPDEPELQQQGWAKKRPLSWVVHEEQYGNRALPGEEPRGVLAEALRTIRPLDAKALGEAWDRQKRMTKPAGSLGMLEIISAQLCGLSRKCPPPIPEPACVAVFAADHGVHAQGVTPWPQEVTAQMVANFLAGGAVVNAFASQIGAEVCVVDVGVATELPAAVQQGRTTGLLPRKVKPGTDDMTQGPAMTREEALKALEIGIETARDLVAAGNRILITGDMGIANTTASAALIAVFTGTDPAEVTGRGTGIDDETHARKVEVIRRALELHHPDPSDPIGVLAAVGGLEHAAIAGFLLGAASLRTPVILDGVIAGSAALVAKAIAPEVLAACIAGHRSAEPGHQAALAKLGLRPLIDLDLRLGEGTGALLALPLVQSAARAMHDVATFDSAGVTEKR
ncbi:nicotinate-nucleotide--dimethylbenzimidazole phosphoribosyltransferase [Kitasatospora kifunensis]|uniref:Nicotinate-nucleotide--dimethylbenzimidazole phosphoribosyltransferase n=1 Tax=Kitasatospora kifunensis TaxID=58351 RepID=A0A7W7R7D8_KITKI|nr:nicotinate-nucleotide--dimethylbenzimidazole phosphoribosyltransferase [Kitasatospora kifunensis]MBB4926751.1 nicotinate-nucleotide--dimethylbenzimidazole phosphoribosyltransferase [Kitasatospora kifunensis]